MAVRRPTSAVAPVDVAPIWEIPMTKPHHRLPVVAVSLPCLVVLALAPLYAAYKGHANDEDVNAVLAVYPALKGTPVASRRLQSGKPLPRVPVMLAFEENGQALETARFDSATGRLVGKGPIRVIVPQFRISPPDLPQFADASCAAKVAPEYRFHEEYEHNGGASSNAIVAVRVKPLPKGARDIDWQSAATRALAGEQVVFFGALKTR